MPKTAEREKRRGVFGWIRWVDDGVFAFEQAFVVFALASITTMVFVDVLARTLQSRESKVGKLICRFGGIEDLATRQWVDANVAPWVSTVLGLLVLYFAITTARGYAAERNSKEEKTTKDQPTLWTRVYPALVAAALIGLVYGGAKLFVEMESWHVYAAMFGAAAIGYIAFAVVKRVENWPYKVGLTLVLTAIFVWFAATYIPEEYTWSKAFSLGLLLWVGMLSASICVHEGAHVRLEAMKKLVPKQLERPLFSLAGLVTAAFCGLMAWLGFIYVFGPEASDDPEMTELFSLFGTRYVAGFEGSFALGGMIEGTEVPDWWTTLSVPVGFGVATLRFLGVAVSAALGGSYGAPAAQEGMQEAEAVAREEEGGVNDGADAKSDADAEANRDDAEEDAKRQVNAEDSEDSEDDVEADPAEPMSVSRSEEQE